MRSGWKLNPMTSILIRVKKKDFLMKKISVETEAGIVNTQLISGHPMLYRKKRCNVTLLSP